MMIGSDMRLVDVGSTCEADCGESSQVQNEKTVRFDQIPQIHIISDDLTQQEVYLLWWNRDEIAEIKRTCRCIAKKSRLLRSITEVIVSDLYHETRDIAKACSDGVELESWLQKSRHAGRFVKNYSTVGSQRGLERWISDEIKLRNKRGDATRHRIRRLQEVPGMTAEVIGQISQAFSRFDRILARLFGEADELAITGRVVLLDEPQRRRRISLIQDPIAILPLREHPQLQQMPNERRKSSRVQRCSKDDNCNNTVSLVQQIVQPLIVSTGSQETTLQ